MNLGLAYKIISSLQIVKMVFRVLFVLVLVSFSLEISDAANCEVKDYSIPEGELLRIIPNTRTWQDCCNECSENTPCSAYGFNKGGLDCRLYNYTEIVLSENNDMVSGILLPPDWESTVPIITTQKPPVCPANNTDTNLRFPHETDCEKSWRCLLGVLYLESCFDEAVPFLFDFYLLRCLPPGIANPRQGCIMPTIPPTQTTNATTGSTTPIPQECPATGTVDIPYNGDCSKYISCQNGYPTVRQCNGGQLFDSVTRKCVTPSEANCFYPPTGGPTVVPTTVASTAIPTTLAPGQCPETGNIDIPYPGDCSKFINCQNNYPTVRECPAGQLFDAERRQCVPSAEANCFSVTGSTAAPTIVPTTVAGTTIVPTSTAVPASTTELPPGQCPQTGTVDIPYPGDCTRYINCQNSYPTVRECPAGQLFDYKQKQCLPSDEAECK